MGYSELTSLISICIEHQQSGQESTFCVLEDIMEERLLARGNFDDTKEAIMKR